MNMLCYSLRNWLSVFLVLLCSAGLFAQEVINQKDAAGKRHGPWKGFFDDAPEEVRYEGTFDHGKETGVFRFYQQGLEQPVALKRFSDTSDSVKVEYLSQKGEIISEGHMLHRKRVGPWKYYHKDSDQLMSLERYEQGVLQGEKLTFYDTGEVAERAFYRNGKLHGERFLYSEDGVVLEHLTYVDGELHGPARFYDASGQLETEGIYRNNRHHGTWKYYKNGKLKEEKSY